MSNRRKLRRPVGLPPGSVVLPPLGELLDAGQGAPVCDCCGHQLEYLGDLVDQGDDQAPAFRPAFSGAGQ